VLCDGLQGMTVFYGVGKITASGGLTGAGVPIRKAGLHEFTHDRRLTQR